MADAVLLVADVAAGIFPERCVRTGERTTTATHAWAVEARGADLLEGLFGVVGVLALRALGRQVLRVPLPVTARAHGTWRRRSLAWAAVTWFALGTLVMSARNADPALAVVGVLVLVAAVLLRRRSHTGFWVGLELRPDAGHVVVRRAHRDFDEEARRLFLRRR